MEADELRPGYVISAVLVCVRLSRGKATFYWFGQFKNRFRITPYTTSDYYSDYTQGAFGARSVVVPLLLAA